MEMISMKICDSSIFKSVSEFTVEDFEGSKILFNHHTEDIDILSGVAWEIFALIDGHKRIKDISLLLHERYADQAYETIETDLKRIIVEFNELGLINAL